MFKLTRPLVFIDLETTGLDRENDRIIQLGFCKYKPGSDEMPEQVAMLINPLMFIPEESTAIHGITDADVKDAETFGHVAADLFAFLSGCDIGGYNSNWFDVPLLYNEFRRAGFTWIPGNLIDVGNIFKIQEPRSLEAAVKFYCRRNHLKAHDALADAVATADVFFQQLGRYADLPDTAEGLALFSNYGCKRADLSGKLAYTSAGVLIYQFGKHKGKPVNDHLDFAEWMYRKGDFPQDTCDILAGVLGYGYYVDNDCSTGDDLPF